MSPIDFGGGMIFPNSYDRDPPEPKPRHPAEEDGCPECGCAVLTDGDRYEWSAWCDNPDCDWSEGWSHPDL